jgi:hypothetical protein
MEAKQPPICVHPHPVSDRPFPQERFPEPSSSLDGHQVDQLIRGFANQPKTAQSDYRS